MNEYYVLFWSVWMNEYINKFLSFFLYIMWSKVYIFQLKIKSKFLKEKIKFFESLNYNKFENF